MANLSQNGVVAKEILTFEQILEAINHQYRLGEYFINAFNCVVEVPENLTKESFNELLEENGTLIYTINWEDNFLFTEDGTKIPAVYGE